MKKQLLLYACLFVFHLHSHAQKEALNWYFGDRAGLSFSKGYAQALTDGAMQAVEGCAAMSDPQTGELLFYTNGIQVWNRQHQVMPNGSGLLGDLSTTQGALIVPFPGQPGRYFLFTLTSIAHTFADNPPGLTYSIVDMGLKGGTGDVEAATKNTRLLLTATEQLTAVPHANGRDYWVITHGVGNDEFHVFLLDAQGVSGHKVMKAGVVRNAGRGSSERDVVRGYLKASPDGSRLASAVWSGGLGVPIELFDFDPATGTVSNAMSLGVGEGMASLVNYGVSFSPDNSKLYISGVVVVQFDLSLPSAEEIINSQVQVTTTPSSGLIGGVQSLQLGPDGRLYNNVSRENLDAFYVINYPNRAGMACEPELVEFDFKGGRVSMGLPNFIQSYFNGLEPTQEAPTDCLKALRVYPNPTSGSVRFGIEGDCHQGQPFSLRIFNAIGQQMASERHGLQLPGKVDLSALAPGLYLLEFTFPHRQVVERVIKLNGEPL